MRGWIIGLLILLMVLGSTVAYIRHDAVKDERDKVALEAAEKYRELSEQYADISDKYNKLKSAKEARRQAQVVKEDRIINENREYYAGDCFDDVGLQHIQQAQSTNSK